MKQEQHPKQEIMLGLNNALDPCSHKYPEGTAWLCDNSRVDESGRWSECPGLNACSSPPSQLACPLANGGSHVKNLAIEGTNRIITGLATGDIVDVGPNNHLYATDGSGPVQNEDGNITALTPPASVEVAENSDAGSRAADGTYYYMATVYDTTYKRESLPSKVIAIELTDNTTKHIRLTITNPASGTETRIYRTRRSMPTVLVYSPANVFFYLGKITTGTTTFDDYARDEEILYTEYEGRGSPPPSDVDFLASYNNRMLYFKGHELYWSSAGRPEEVALEYTLTYSGGGIQGADTTIPCKPRLGVGTYGEAKYEITELAGQKVTAAFLKDGRLWVCTSGMIGYLEAERRLEGYRFRVYREGIGAVNDKVIARTPYGVFGADRLGVWLMTNDGRLDRISKGVIDITAGTTKSTSLSQSDITNSFGVWLPNLEEYWWCVYRSDLVTNGTFDDDTDWTKGAGWSIVAGRGLWVEISGSGELEQDLSVVAGHLYEVTYTIATIADSGQMKVQLGGTDGTLRTSADTYTEQIEATNTGNLKFFPSATGAGAAMVSIDNVIVKEVGTQIVYQANRRRFAGPYRFQIFGGCSFVSAGGAQAFLNDASSPLVGVDGLPPSSPAKAQHIQVWFGQADLSTVKTNIYIEIIYASITADKDVTGIVYHNKIASTTGSHTSSGYLHNDDNLVAKMETHGRGRMFMVDLSVPADCAAPFLYIGYTLDGIPWLSEKGEE